MKRRLNDLILLSLLLFQASCSTLSRSSSQVASQGSESYSPDFNKFLDVPLQTKVRTDEILRSWGTPISQTEEQGYFNYDIMTFGSQKNPRVEFTLSQEQMQIAEKVYFPLADESEGKLSFLMNGKFRNFRFQEVPSFCDPAITLHVLFTEGVIIVAKGEVAQSIIMGNEAMMEKRLQENVHKKCSP